MGEKELLQRSYKAFYELPWKTEKMFDVMDDTAFIVFHDCSNVSPERWQQIASLFYDTFVNHARDEEQKTIIGLLLEATL